MAVDTEDLINSAIDARAARDAQRAQIAQRREQIARQLSGVSGGRRNRGQIASLQAELANLGAAERNLHHQDTVDQANVALRANTAFRNAHLAASEAKLNRDADVATAAANLQNGLARLQAKYPNRILDSNQAAAFHRELSDLRDANPLGLRNESTAAMLRQASEFHDKERERVVNRLQGTLFKQANLSPEQFVSGLDSARATNVPLKKADGTAPTKDEIEKARATNGQTVAMEVNGVTKLFDRGLFDSLKSTFGNQPIPQVVTAADTGDQTPVDVSGPRGANATIMSTNPLRRETLQSLGITEKSPNIDWAKVMEMQNNADAFKARLGLPPPTGVPADQQAQVAGFRDAAQASAWRSGQPLTAPPGSINPPPTHMENGPTASGGYASRVPAGSKDNASPPTKTSSPSDLINQPSSVPLIGAPSSQVASAPQPAISGQPTNLPTPTATPAAPATTTQVSTQPTPPAIPPVQQPTVPQSPSTAPQIAETRYLNGVPHTLNTETKRWEPQQ